jgi:ribonuclease BN (tRNA processing enzyme)
MSKNKVVLLGTKGGPRMEKGLSWSTCSVIEVEGHPYIVDCGLGVTRQFVEAGYSLSQVDNIFITHHHSDHNLEFGPLVHTLWTSGTSDHVSVYGPKGTQNLLNGFLKSLEIDINVRIEDEKQRDLASIIKVSEISEGLVMEDERVKVTALKVVHGLLENCFAFKFETKDKKVVFSGDTIYFPPLIEFSKDADLLVHEVMLERGINVLAERLKKVKPNLIDHLMISHTTAEDAAKLAKEANVKHMVFNHYVPHIPKEFPNSEFVDAAKRVWDGKITAGYDLCEIDF